MSLSALIQQHGYTMVFVGALLEGESVLIAAGFAVHRGLLKLPELIAVAALGSALGDQLCFALGRRHGRRLLARWPSIASRAQRVLPMLDRHPGAAIVALRFLYGLRTAGPIAIGMRGMPRWRFALFNALGALIWATTVCGLGYQFGNALQWLLGDLRAIEEAVIAALLLAGVGVAWIHWLRSRASARTGSDGPARGRP